MSSYYHTVVGNLNMGDIAKSSDINHIQRHIEDSEKAMLSDLHDGESYVLGSNEVYKNSFILQSAPKELGRYIDSKNIFDIDDTKYFKINQYDVKQPIVKTKTSLYSIIASFRNTSTVDIPITCKLQDEYGNVLRSNTVTLAKNTLKANYEIVFDLDFYPTPPNLDFEELVKRDGKDIPPRTKEESFDEGFDEEHAAEDYDKQYFSAGVSKLFFVIERVGKNAVDLVETSNEQISFDAETSLGVYYQEGSLFPDKDMFAETNGNKGEENYNLTNGNIYYQDVYANETTYLCSGGRAIIDGEPVRCLDTHISVEGASSIGNVLTQIYLDNSGHLQAANKQASLTTDIDSFKDDLNDPLPMSYLPIALILTYFNAQYGTSKEPLIIQDSYGQLPRSHHERLRRLEKKVDWNEDISLPARLKCVMSGADLVDKEGESLANLPHTAADANDAETLSNDNIFITTDEKGNVIVKLTDAVTQTIPVTLKEKLKDSDGKEIKLEETDVLNISSFSSVEHMVHDSTKGTLMLDNEKAEGNTTGIATTAKEAKLTEFNPWDDSAANRPTGTKYDKNEREYKVVSGKNGANDWDSSYPGMTFYTNTNYSLKKLTIPIHKFKNCSSVKFYIWKRQDTNNKKNQVPYFKKQQLIYTSKDFSLKKAKEKGKYQYMDDGFTINFGKGGLSLKKGQYVIVAVPKPKSGTGSLYVETYKPKNSKDFCIRYKGAANASHFDYSEAYQEIWYNSAKAIASEENYYKTGTVISKTLTWKDKTLEKIKTVKPIIGENLTLGNKNKDSYELYVSTGGKWIKVTPGKENTINEGGAQTFKWKLVFKGDGKSTPKLAYNSKEGYAIKFILTREKAGSFMEEGATADLNKNMCITSKSFDGDNILRDYIGDMNFGLTNTRFEGYEFARVWADDNLNDKLMMDIQASDKSINYNLKDSNNNVISGNTDLWSLHYCDLTLNDFSKINVDYSDYDEEIEYDENNMRLKLDSNHSYNDDDIQILALKDFTKVPNTIDESTDNVIKFKNSSVNENQLFMKKTFETPLDLTKYTGLKFNFSVDNVDTTSMLLEGLGIYISSAIEKEVPSNKKNKPENLYKTPLKDTAIIPTEIDPDTSSYSYYEGQLIEIIHEIDTDKDGNKLYSPGYYQYIKQYDETKDKYIYKLQQVFDLRSYNIYEIGFIECDDKTKDFEVRIELDQDSNNLKHVKEIGIISLNDQNIFNVEETSIRTEITATSDTTGTIKATLKDIDGNPLGGKTVKVDNTNVTTNTYGVVSKTGLTGSGQVSFEFDGVIIQNNDGKTVYSKSALVANYDFTAGGIKSSTVKTISYDESITGDYTKTTSLTASTSDNKNIKVVLKDDSNNVLKDKTIICGSAQAKTNNSGEATFELSGQKTVTFVYNAELVEGTDNKKTLYKPAGLEVSYDFRTAAERVTTKSKEIVSADSIDLTLNSVRAVSEEVLKIYDPKELGDNNKLQFKIGPDVSGITVNNYNKIKLDTTTYDSGLGSDSTVPNITTLTPGATQINIKHKDSTLSHGEKMICYINNPFKGGLSKYKHLGIQLATDVYIPKDCLKINICAGLNGTDPVASVNLPTMNSIYYPNTAGSNINLSQVFKKININDTQIKSISISITSYFYEFINKIVKNTKPAINLFIGKIVLYRAETIPIYHNKMRFKFYSTTNGEIDHSGKQVSTDTINIRKIGAVLDYD